MIPYAKLGLAARGAPRQGQAAEVAPATVGAFSDTFDGPVLDEQAWRVTRENDFQESVIDVVNGRLRMRAATIGTDDRTVKFHGVRTRTSVVDFGKQPAVSFQLDWNNQANGCYLTAGVCLCSVATDTNPRNEADWLKIEYIGVPPGKNGRCLIASKTNGRLRHLFTEGWPKEQRTGREIGVLNLELRLGPDRKLVVIENGKTLFETEDCGLAFEAAYVYLQMSSHSNYPPRELFFDEVRVVHQQRE